MYIYIYICIERERDFIILYIYIYIYIYICDKELKGVQGATSRSSLLMTPVRVPWCLHRHHSTVLLERPHNETTTE